MTLDHLAVNSLRIKVLDFIFRLFVDLLLIYGRVGYLAWLIGRTAIGLFGLWDLSFDLFSFRFWGWDGFVTNRLVATLRSTLIVLIGY